MLFARSDGPILHPDVVARQIDIVPAERRQVLAPHLVRPLIVPPKRTHRPATRPGEQRLAGGRRAGFPQRASSIGDCWAHGSRSTLDFASPAPYPCVDVSADRMSAALHRRGVPLANHGLAATRPLGGELLCPRPGLPSLPGFFWMSLEVLFRFVPGCALLLTTAFVDFSSFGRSSQPIHLSLGNAQGPSLAAPSQGRVAIPRRLARLTRWERVHSI